MSYAAITRNDRNAIKRFLQRRRLNDAVCVCTGEVRAPTDPGQAAPDLVVDVAELIWEPIAD